MADQTKSGLTGEKAVLVGFWMAADEVLKAGMRPAGRSGCGDDSAEVGVAGEDGSKTVEHAVGGFAYGEDAKIRELAQVISTAGAAQSVAADGKAAFDRGAGVNRFEGTEEDAASELLGDGRVAVNGIAIRGIAICHGSSIGPDGGRGTGRRSANPGEPSWPPASVWQVRIQTIFLRTRAWRFYRGVGHAERKSAGDVSP